MKKYSYFPITKQFYLFAKNLINKYRHLLCDYSNDSLFQDIESLKPHFYIVLCGIEPMGVIYLDNWVGSEKQTHCCDLHTFADRKFFGKQIREVGKLFIQDAFKEFNLYRMQSQVPINNQLAIKVLKDVGFKEEGLLRDASLIKGKLYDDIVLGITKKDIENG